VLRIAGISVELHLSWLVIGFLVTYSLAEIQFPTQFPGWGTGIYWLVSARHWFKGPKVQGTAEELAAIEQELSV